MGIYFTFRHIKTSKGEGRIELHNCHKRGPVTLERPEHLAKSIRYYDQETYHKAFKMVHEWREEMKDRFGGREVGDMLIIDERFEALEGPLFNRQEIGFIFFEALKAYSNRLIRDRERLAYWENIADDTVVTEFGRDERGAAIKRIKKHIAEYENMFERLNHVLDIMKRESDREWLDFVKAFAADAKRKK